MRERLDSGLATASTEATTSDPLTGTLQRERRRAPSIDEMQPDRGPENNVNSTLASA